MRIYLSDYYYTNKLIPVYTDSTLLKVIKVGGILFLGPLAFLIDCTSKLLALRNIVLKKDEARSISSIRKEHLGSTEQSNIELEDIKNDQKISKEFFKEMHAKKYQLFFAAQKNALETAVLDHFKVDPQVLLENLELFFKKEPIDPNFSKIFDLVALPLYEHLSEVIKILLKEHFLGEVRIDYALYTRAIRNALATSEYINNKGSKFAILIQELCFSKIAETVLTDLQEEFIVKSVIKLDPKQELTADSISELILAGNEALKRAPEEAKKSLFQLYLGNACNAAGIESDQLCGPNVSELILIQEFADSAKEFVGVLRHPTPTIEKGINALFARLMGRNSTIVAPEYIGFLDGLKRKKIPFLYVNHQYMDKEIKGLLNICLSADNNRAEAVQKLEESHGEIFHFLSFPFDGPIITEIAKNDLTVWKENLVNALVEEKQGFRIPNKFRKIALGNEEKKKPITKLLNDLQKLYFFGKSELNEKDRRILLVIFYSYLKEYFKAEYKIQLMSSVCKDNKDRGNISACIDQALSNLKLGTENDSKTLSDLYLRSLSPFIIKYQEIVDHRLKMLIDLLEFIPNLNENQKMNIRAFNVNNQHQIIKQSIPQKNT